MTQMDFIPNSIFEVGDQVVCVNDTHVTAIVTKNKCYEVLGHCGQDKSMIKIMNDLNGTPSYVYSHRFKLVPSKTCKHPRTRLTLYKVVDNKDEFMLYCSGCRTRFRLSEIK